MVAPGANYKLSVEEIDARAAVFEEAYPRLREHLSPIDEVVVGSCMTDITDFRAVAAILEGKRVINLRRLLAWHAEARATA